MSIVDLPRFVPSTAHPVSVFEVGLRDGLQNEATSVPVATRLEWLSRLAAAGIKNVEVGAFVHPKVEPMRPTGDVCAGLTRQPSVRYSALVPNIKGYERAHAAGLSEVAVLTAASQEFNQRNLNMSVEQSLQVIKDIITRAKADNVLVRGYLSMAFGNPYREEVSNARVIELAARLLEMGCYEVSLGDTLGQATVQDVRTLLAGLRQTISIEKLALHLHDTHGRAIQNILAGVARGIRTVDASIGGLGGCPYATCDGIRAPGNVATEAVVAALHSAGHQTGINLPALEALALDVKRHVGIS